MLRSNSAIEKAKAALKNKKISNLARRQIDYARDPRFTCLNDKEAYFRGTIYDKRPYNWYGELLATNKASFTMPLAVNVTPDNVPISLRRPDTPYHLGRTIVNRFVSMLVGEHRFPFFQVPNDKSTEMYVNKLSRNIQLKAHFTEAATIGGAIGSTIVMFKVVDGQFRIETFNSKWCNVVWEDFQNADMEAFCVSYPYEDLDYDEEKGQWVTKTYLYRRLVTKEVDIHFHPQEAVVDMLTKRIYPKDETALPSIDEDNTTEHGYTAMPAVFIQNMPRFDQADGDTSPEGAYELIDRINENLSAVNAALQGNLNPTLVLKMTPEDYKKLQTMGGFVQTGATGMGIVVGATGDAKFIEVTCENLKVAMEVIALLRTYALELSDCVIADPHRITGAAQSASAIDKLYGPMLSKVDLMRTQYGDRGLKKLIGKMLEAFHALSGVVKGENGPERRTFKPVKVLDPETKKMITVVPAKDITEDDIELLWGDYFLPAPADVLQATQAANIATGNKPIMTQADAARYVSPYLKMGSVDQTVADLEKEAAEARDHELKLTALGGAAKAKPGPENPGEAVKNQPPRSSGSDD